MSNFPTLPFELGQADGDQYLLSHLKHDRCSRFPYLREPSRKQVEGLQETKGLQDQCAELKHLWPSVLTDALFDLKCLDPRECGAKPLDRVKLESLFDEASLGVTQLRKVFEAFTEFETIMSGADPERYRDHIAHAFRVWILGDGLIREALKDGVTVDKEFDGVISAEELHAMWALVALCHDVGYPVTNVERVNDKTRATLRELGLSPGGDPRFAFSQQVLAFHESILQLMSSGPVVVPGDTRKRKSARRYVTHLQSKYYLKFLKSFDRLEHGVVSSLLISKALVYFLESDLCLDSHKPLTREDARQFLMRREMLRAIASHTCHDIYHLAFDSLGFLLFIADELQEWGRPTFYEAIGSTPHRIASTLAVEAFSADSVTLCVSADGTWSAEVAERAKATMDRLHRVLRLALGRGRDVSKRQLLLQFKDAGDTKASIQLRDGQIIRNP